MVFNKVSKIMNSLIVVFNESMTNRKIFLYTIPLAPKSQGNESRGGY